MAFCPNCGAPHDPGDKFCNRCGNNLAAPNPAPQNPAPQQPQYTQYQAPRYQPAGGQLRNNSAAAKKLAVTALILMFVGVLLDIVFLLAQKMMAVGFQVTFPMIMTNVISCLIAAILPILTLVFSAKANSKAGKILFICALVFLALQVVGIIVLGITYWIFVSSGYINIQPYGIASRFFSYIAGTDLTLPLFSILPPILHGYFEIIHHYWYQLIRIFSCVAYLVGAILSLSAAGKLKKS